MTKRKLLFLSIIFTCVIPANSDTRNDSKLAIGFNLGRNFSSMRTPNDNVEIYGLDFKSGADLGIFLQYSPQKFFGLSLELLFATKGYESIIYDSDDKKYEMVAIRNYIELPLIAKLQVPLPRMYNPYIFFGIGPALNVTAKNKYKSALRYINGKDVFDSFTINLHDDSTYEVIRGTYMNYTFKDFHRWFDLPFVFGLGHVISFSKLAIVINTRFSLSLLGFNRLSSSMKNELNSKRIIYKELEEKYFHFSVLTGLAYKF